MIAVSESRSKHVRILFADVGTDIDHPQGMGALIHDKCDATWHIVIPDNLQSSPYYAVIAFGEHTHIPPPPSVAKDADVKALEAVLRPMLTPGLTRCTYFINRV